MAVADILENYISSFPPFLGKSKTISYIKPDYIFSILLFIDCLVVRKDNQNDPILKIGIRESVRHQAVFFKFHSLNEQSTSNDTVLVDDYAKETLAENIIYVE